MKFLRILILFLLLVSMPVFAKDKVQKDGQVVEGRIFSYADGLIHITSNGLDKSFTRQKNADFFGDFIEYREKPLSKNFVNTYCRITYVDKFYVIYETKNSRTQVPRYRVSTLIFNAD